MEGLTLQQALPEESEFAYQVKKSAFREYVEKGRGWDEETQRRLHDQRFTPEDFQIVRVGGEPVGFLAIAVADNCLQVHQLFVLPEFQGRGIGLACMERVMEEGRQLRRPLSLKVLKVNPRARTFYERLGFVPVGETDTHNLMEWSP
jgi:GNAT superfamily N-acetyltransferase